MNPILKQVVAEKRSINEAEAYKLLSVYGMPVPEAVLVRCPEELERGLKRLRFPLVLKVNSPDILHKSELGGVITGIKSGDEALRAYQTMLKTIKKQRPDARLEGVLLVEQAEKGLEVIIGMNRDPQFGATVMFGLGGIFTEVLKDVSFRVCPLQGHDVEEMFGEIRGKVLLKGFRGQPPVDLKALRDIILKVCRLALDNPVITEIDLNPVLAYPQGALPVDARIILEP